MNSVNAAAKPARTQSKGSPKGLASFLRSSLLHLRWHYRTWFTINLVFVCGLSAWLFLDPRFEASMDWWQFQSSPAPTELSYHMADWWWLRFRNGVLLTLVSVTGLAVVIMLLQFVFGNTVDRSIRAMLGLTAICALWLSIGTHWQDIVWQGKQYRLHQILNQFQQATDLLRADWPKEDGELKDLGPFMAYPVGRPRTLVMLTLPQMEDFPGSFSVVEGEPGGPFRFELVNKEEGDWLEWHPKGSYPATFIGGLGDMHRLQKSHPLEDGWHLARYVD